MSQARTIAKRIVAYSLSASLALPGPLHAALTDIHYEPLAQPAASVKPNVMLILDDSGSMEQQYTPDYLGRRFGGSNALCFDAGDDSSGTINTTLDNCEPGDPPLMTPEINTQYYNPEIRYFPAVNFDGTAKPSMNSANTTGWTAVPTDGVSPAGVTTYQNDTLDMVVDTGTTVATTNLVGSYPDRVWCTSQGAAVSDTVNCKTNSSYNYPDWQFPYGRSGTSVKYRVGPPYYYRLAATEYCTDLTLTNCTASTAPTGSFTVPATVRFCTDSTLTNCQAKRQGSYTYPKFVGTVNTGVGNPGVVSTATITVNAQKDGAGGTISAIFVNGVNIISGNISLAAGFTPAAAAAAISGAINCAPTSPEYHATVSSNVVTVRYGPSASGCVTNATASGTTGALPNGYTVQVNFNVTSTTSATATATITGTSNGDSISSFSVSGVNLISSSVSCTACGGNNTQRNNYIATQLAARINSDGSGYTATRSGNVVTITGPAGSGSTLNGVTPNETSPGLSVALTAFTGGVTTGDVNLTTTNFAGGVDTVPASQPSRANVGTFRRVNIVPFQDPPTNSIASTYTKFPARTDCVGAVCTYDEEMTNFANWYAYYRSRMQMAKTAIGRAFVGITDAFRVGFITINPTDDLANRFLAVNDFGNAASGQKDLWYRALYKQESHGSTPLREALSRVGRYYAGLTDGINTGMPASPIQLACQPSYSILTTDGYWNGNGGVKLDSTSIGNQDNVNSGFSLRNEARYDGALAGASNTLADVALYYYKTDLRTDLTDQVPASSREPNAPHQHMTTFTVGMGLAGRLTFHPQYEAGLSPDFEKLKLGPTAGGLDWPVPAENTETALDDLWHAAVNGRGTFFSAKDPSELASSISETLNSVSTRIGAGAAAATSNLQPVAGDNFAFTAQYETVTWIGDVKARTIDLSNGAVASRELWSAAERLNRRDHTTRRIYTFDAADTTASAGPPVENGNRLKSFCSPGSIGLLGYPQCNDGTGLSIAEMDYFLPTADSPAPSNEPALVQSGVWFTDGSGRTVSATKEKVVDYLRGDVSNESTGGSALSDLFRDRVSLLGDIISAQPAYVKASPFGYNTGNFVGRDPYYTEFKNTTDGVTANRKGTVYVAANDGMLHAFETDPDNNPYFQTAGISTPITTDDTFTGTLNDSATGGEGSERWAYIPGFVLPHMKRLADTPYVHKYFTDGSPVVGDICFGHTAASPCSSQANWRTILVAGVNSGGRGYYALDVTDPDNPKGMWELKGGTGTACLTNAEANSGSFSEDCNIGFSYGNPVIVKRKVDGKWVVILTSGYNNVSPGDGQGYLYIVDAQTGRILQRLSTGVGSATDPSGLGRINAWVDDAFFNNVALTVYGGDLKGNLWRFQLDDAVAEVPLNSITRLATLTSDGVNGQPITTKPELGLVSGKRVIFVATGKFLGLSDKSDVQRQSVYAIKDDMNAVSTGTPPSPIIAMTRAGSFPSSTISGFVRQDLTASTTNPTTERTSTSNAVAFTDSTVFGWFIDLPDGGSGSNGSERVNVDPILQLGTLVVPSNVPNTDPCSAGGFGWLSFLDYKTGGFVPGATGNMVSVKVTSSLIVGINVVRLPGGTVKTISTTADNQQLTKDTPVAPSNLVGRRVSWRELFFE